MPARGLLGVVAGLAEPLGVVAAGGTVPGVVEGVVEVAHRGVTPRGAADLVAQPDEPGERPAEPAAPAIHGDQVSGVGVGVEPPEPQLLSGGDSAGDDLAGQLGGDRTVPLEVGGLVTVAEQVVVCHHQAQRYRRSTGLGGLALEDPSHQGVGHQLTPAARITGGARGVGGPGESGVGRNAVLDGEEGGQPGHRVGCRPEADVAVGLGPTPAGHDRGRVEPCGLGLEPAHQLAQTHALQPRPVARERGVDAATVDLRQAGGLARDQGRLPLGDPPLAPRPPGVWQLAHRLRQREVALCAVG